MMMMIDGGGGDGDISLVMSGTYITITQRCSS